MLGESEGEGEGNGDCKCDCDCDCDCDLVTDLLISMESHRASRGQRAMHEHSTSKGGAEGLVRIGFQLSKTRHSKTGSARVHLPQLVSTMPAESCRFAKDVLVPVAAEPRVALIRRSDWEGADSPRRHMAILRGDIR